MAASNILHKIHTDAIHSVNRVGSQLHFYKYAQPVAAVAGSFRSRLPFDVFSLNNIRSVSIYESHSEYVTTFHYNVASDKYTEERVRWAFRYNNYNTMEFSEWRDETDAQILKVLEIVRNTEMENSARDLK